jgi:hypothetical protein
MEKKYVINESTLTGIADAIRNKDFSGDLISANDFANRINLLGTTIEEYMRIMDYLDYPKPLDENNFTEEKIERCAELYNFYLEMEDIT